jgi:hypothetical protein
MDTVESMGTVESMDTVESSCNACFLALQRVWISIFFSRDVAHCIVRSAHNEELRADEEAALKRDKESKPTYNAIRRAGVRRVKPDTPR